ncbi:hypothetical protein LCGC14_1356120, partial [marine sediment metagenome]
MSLRASISAVKKKIRRVAKATKKVAGVKKKSKPKTPEPGSLTTPNPEEPKSGCLWCPLFPFNKDFADYADHYCRDWQKIIEKEGDPHIIHTRGVCERPWKKVKVLFVGEAPGKEEDYKGGPFVGRSGKLIRTVLEETTGLTPEDYAFTNVVRCRPPRNRDPRVTEIRSCGYELIQEIKARKPDLIVVLGNISLEFLTSQTGITTFAGHFLKSTHPDWKDRDVLACFHPAFVLRFDHHFTKFVETIAEVKEYVLGNYTPLPGVGDYHVLTELEDVKKLLKRFQKAKKVTFDTETGSLTPFQDVFPRLLCFSFSDKAGEGYTVPYDHEDSPWCEGGEKAHERGKIAGLLRSFFQNGTIPKVAQNEKFDRQHIRHALGCEPTNVVRDTMLTHLVIDERRGTHGLKTLAFVYSGMGGYERPLEKYCQVHKEANFDKGGSYANVPGKILFEYAAMDADVTYRVDDGLLEEQEYVEHERLQRLATEFLPMLSEVLADLEYVGVQVDKEVVKKLDHEYTAKMADYAKQITKLPAVRQFVANQIKAGKAGKKKGEKFTFNPGSHVQLRKVMFGYYNLTPIEMTDKGFEILVARHQRTNVIRKKSGKSLVKFSETVAAAIEKKEWEHFSTKADVLHEYERQGNDLAPLILKYREYETLYGTFVAPLLDRLDGDGRVHTSYLPHGTVTGRLASRDPNNQNIPPSAKPVYISRFGDQGVILQADYSQIELRIAASWFNSPKMIEAYKKGLDLHLQTAADIDHTTLALFLKLPESERKEKRT